MIVFGTGTGRCGTHALSLLLNAQLFSSVTHEQADTRYRGDELAARALDSAESALRAGKSLAGDCAFYYLQVAERLMAHGPQVKIVYLWRNRDEVVQSFLRKCRDRNHWTSPGSPHWHEDDLPGNGLFPTYDLPKAQAIKQYWKDCEVRAWRLLEQYPEQFVMFDTNVVLNSQEGQDCLLSFLDVPLADHVYHVGLRTNQSAFQPLVTITPNYEPTERCDACHSELGWWYVEANGTGRFACHGCREAMVNEVRHAVAA